MADGTKIEWTEATWNPITGCSVHSPGCTNCYAMKLAGTRLRNHPSREGLTIETKAGPVWTGEVRFNHQWLDQPLRWSRPRLIFVCAHADLFHEAVPDEWIDRVFAVMALAPRHTFQVLTKRADRMRAYLSGFTCDGARRFHVADAAGRMMEDGDRAHATIAANCDWPLPNVWLGVSAEDQLRADERVPDLIATPAAVRWVSAEPLLGPIDLGQLQEGLPKNAWLTWLDALDWVVVGGESGHGARPMHPDWARNLRDQCAETGVAFHFKQWGEWRSAHPRPSETPGKYAMMARDPSGWTHSNAVMLDRYSRQFNAFGSVILEKVGKRAAGRLLDGVTHDGMPEARGLP